MFGFGIFRQAKSVEELKKSCEKYEHEIHAHSMALENMANERDSCKSLAQELQERIKVGRIPGTP